MAISENSAVQWSVVKCIHNQKKKNLILATKWLKKSWELLGICRQNYFVSKKVFQGWNYIIKYVSE